MATNDTPSSRRTRKEEGNEIKSKRNLMKVIKKAITNIDYGDIRLSTVEFMMISNLYQINSNYIFQFLELAILYDAVAVCIMYMILTSMLGVPLSMLLTFMSSYTKKSFLDFWQCVPLFEGLGYSTGIIRLCIEIFNVVHAGIALLFFLRIQQPEFLDDLQNCKYAVDTKFETDCVIARFNQSHDCRDTQPFTAYQVYYRVHITNYVVFDDWQVPSVNMESLWSVIVVWILIFLLSCLGMRRIHRITMYGQFFFVFVLMGLSLTVICLAESGEIQDFRYYDNPLIKFEFWVSLILHTAEINYLGNTIWIGTMKPDSLDPKFAALLNPPMKMMVFMPLLGLMSVVTKDNALYYHLTNMECLSIAADDIIFVLVPDVLLRYKPWKFLLSLWYGGLFYFLILPPAYSIIGFLISIEEKYPKIIKYRILMCTIICGVGLIISLPLVTEIGAIVIIIWKYCGLSVLISSLMVMVNVAIFFLYTTDRIIDDYTFTFGHPPERYWTALWRCCPLFSLFAFLFAITFQTDRDPLAANYNVVLVASYIHTAMVLAPIFIIAVIKFCTHVQNRRLGDLIQPSPEWGPKDPELRLARQRYYPRRKVRFRIGEIVCKHKCSVSHAGPYRREKDAQKAKVDLILDLAAL